VTKNLDSGDHSFNDCGVEPESDRWSRWLLKDRFGGNCERQQEAMNVLFSIRDRVLTGARLQDQDLQDQGTVLDVGCGDGLLGFAALDRIAPDNDCDNIWPPN
jgi:arsenite methyltransferase